MGEIEQPTGSPADATPASVNGALTALPPPAIPPLIASGLVVKKGDLVAALRLYVPQLVDIRQTDDESFILDLLTPAGAQQAKHD